MKINTQKVANKANTYAVLIDENADVVFSIEGANEIQAGGLFAGITVHDTGSVTFICPDHPQGTCRPTADLGGDLCTNTLQVRGSQKAYYGSGMVTMENGVGAPAIGGLARGAHTGPASFPTTGTGGGEIVIAGGVIDAGLDGGTGHCPSARIGSGYGAEEAGTITISGGYVTAKTGTQGGAVIGGARTGGGGDITISGNAYVFADAAGGAGAAIGGGGAGDHGWDSGEIDDEFEKDRLGGSGGSIQILDNAVVKAYGGTGGGAGIGPGSFIGFFGATVGKSGTIAIADTANVTAFATKQTPAISSISGIDGSGSPLSMVNCYLAEPIKSGEITTVNLLEKDTTTVAETVKLPSGFTSFAIPMAEGEYNIEVSVSVTKPEFTLMRHIREQGNKTFLANGDRTPRGMKYYSSTQLQLAIAPVNYGDTANIKADKIGMETPEKQPVSWQWQTSGWFGFEDITGATEEAYTLPNCKPLEHNDTVFRVKAVLADGTTVISNEAKLAVKPLPLTIAANTQVASSGEILPTPTLTYDGFIGGDTPENTQYMGYITQGDPTGGTEPKLLGDIPVVYEENGVEIMTAPTTPGVYPIVIKYEPSANHLVGYNNYDVTTVNGNLLVEQALVQFDANGGTGSMADQLFALNTAQKLTKNTFTREGYTFVGWDTLPAKGGTSYTDEQPVTFLSSAAVTLFAQWKAVETPGGGTGGGGGGGGETVTKYLVTYKDGDHGTLKGETKETVAKGNKPQRVPQATPDEGYVFAGWVIEKEKQTVDPKTVAIYKDTTFTATYRQGALSQNDHVHYVAGDDTGLFRPSDPITRGEAAAIFARLTEGDGIGVQGKQFTDVFAGDWYAKPIEKVQAHGIVAGYPDGSFRPTEYITRAEFATMAAHFEEISYAGGATFSDVPESHWASALIRSASSKGWISGYPDGTFRPENQITRAEVVTLVNQMLDRTADEVYIDANEEELKFFPDLKKNYWAYYGITEAANDHGYEMDPVEKWTTVK